MEYGFFDTARLQISEDKVVSFDVFGTLLLRTFSDPKNIFRYIEESYQLEGFYKARINAEKKARERSGGREICFDEIYEYLPEYDKRIESDTEEKILFRNPEVSELFEYALTHAKAVVLISDMYFPREYIERLLLKNDVRRYKKLYVSSEYGKTKASGELFKTVLDELEISPADLIHIGDDLHSDMYVPKKMGIKTFRYDTPIDRFFADHPYRKKKDLHWCEDFFVQLSAYRASADRKTYWERFGYEIGGPVCFSYLSWVMECVKDRKDGVTDIAFVSRDGYLLKKYFDMLAGNRYPTITSHYVYAPRCLTIVSELAKNNEDWDFPAHYWKFVFDHYRNALPEQSRDAASADAHEWFLRNRDALMPLLQDDCQEYERYIRNENFGDGNVLMVDSITQGHSAQKLLENVLGRETLGLYWVTLKSDKHLANRTYQAGNYHLLLSWMLVEFILSAPTPSVNMVKDLMPVYNETPYEEHRQECFTKMEKGIDRFFCDILAFGLDNIRIPEEIIRHYLNEYCQNGTKEDIRHFSEIKYSRKLDHSDAIALNPFVSKTDKDFGHILTRMKRWIVLHPRIFCIIKKIIG